MVKSKLLFLFLLLAIPLLLRPTNLKPWFGNEYETEVRVDILYQNYPSLALSHSVKQYEKRKHEHRKYNANDAFYL